MLNFEGKVFLAGMEGFGKELSSLGMTYIGPGVDPIQGEPAEWAKTTLDPEVQLFYTLISVSFPYPIVVPYHYNPILMPVLFCHHSHTL